MSEHDYSKKFVIVVILQLTGKEIPISLCVPRQLGLKQYWVLKQDFGDVTLVCEDNQLIGSHQFILAAARMPPEGGQPIMNTVIRAKKDHLASITDDLKAEVVKAFSKDDVLEAINILMDKLKKAVQSAE